jgi:hypothetical protein
LKTLTKRMAAASKLAPKNFSLKNFSYAFRNERGAFDLPSILVGVLVVAVMALGVMAVVFGIIPFSQDKSAQQSLAAVSTAEGTYYGQSTDSTFTTASAYNGSIYSGLKDLQTQKLLGADVTSVAVTGGTGGWVAVTKSDSGQWFWATSAQPTPAKFTPTTAADSLTVGLGKAVTDAAALLAEKKVTLGTINADG